MSRQPPPAAAPHKAEADTLPPADGGDTDPSLAAAFQVVPGLGSARPRPPATAALDAAEREAGGPSGPEPTRFGDWERKGRCIDF